MNTRQLSEAVNRNRRYSGKEWINWELYDSMLTTVSITQELIFFQNTVGGVGRARTNMKQSGQVPSPWTFLVTSLAFEMYNLSGTMLQTTASVNPLSVIVSQGHFDFNVDPNIMYEGTLASLMNMNVEQTLTDSGAATTDIGSMYFRPLKLGFPIFLDANCSFNLKMTVTTPAAAGGYSATDTILKWRLLGMMKRNR